VNSRRYAASCGDAPAHAHVLQLVRLPGWPLTERAANFTHTSSHAIDDAAPIMLVTFRLEVAWSRLLTRRHSTTARAIGSRSSLSTFL